MRFFVGLHQPSDAQHFDARNRRSDFKVADWIIDSQAFSTILTHGGYPHPVEEYAMAWSFRARREGRNANDYREAARFRDSVARPSPYQGHFIEEFI